MAKKQSLMSKMHLGSASPTMIIPSGTQIRVDSHGQLSIRAPGNLVIQNSGSYATLESVSGSIRIEPNVQVEAVTIRCAETCYVQGSLTAWQVVAKTLQLDGTAEAHVLMQQTEKMEVGREARLVGNFHSEKELFLLFSRFARQVRSLPFAFSDEPETAEKLPEREVRPLPEPTDLDEATQGNGSPESPDAPTGPGAVEELPEELFFAVVLLEREADKPSYGPSSRRILLELVKLLRGGDLETLRHTHRTLFSRVKEPGDDVRRARDLVASYYQDFEDG